MARGGPAALVPPPARRQEARHLRLHARRALVPGAHRRDRDGRRRPRAGRDAHARRMRGADAQPPGAGEER